MKQKRAAEWFQRLWDQYKFVLLVGLAGIVLLIWPTGGGGDPNAVDVSAAAPVTTAEELDALETKMEKILSRIDGVGELHLMLTLESGASTELAQDAVLSANSDEGYRQSMETVVLSGADGDETVVTRRNAPVCRGALVVCTGGEDAAVRLAVVQAVSALTGLRSDRIMVIKCQ